MKIHGAVISPNVRKVLAVLNLKALDYEQIHVLPGTQTPEYLAISPRGFIPAFEESDFHTADSTVIAEYLEEKYPDITIFPSSFEDRARSRGLTEYAGSVVFPCCATLFNECIVKPNYYKQAKNEEAVENAINNRLPAVLSYLEAQMPETGFLFGDFGLADISIVSPLINAEYADYFVDKNRWPKLADFVNRVKEHPAFATCLQAEEELMAILKP